MTTLASHRDLEVWQRSMDFAARVYRFSESFPRDERFGLTVQVRRAAVSVPTNIAEGAARVGTRDYIRFIGIARGSLAEVETHLDLSVRLGVAREADVLPLREAGATIGRMLTGLHRSLCRKAARTSRP